MALNPSPTLARGPLIVLARSPTPRIVLARNPLSALEWWPLPFATPFFFDALRERHVACERKVHDPPTISRSQVQELLDFIASELLAEYSDQTLEDGAISR